MLPRLCSEKKSDFSPEKPYPGAHCVKPVGVGRWRPLPTPPRLPPGASETPLWRRPCSARTARKPKDRTVAKGLPAPGSDSALPDPLGPCQGDLSLWTVDMCWQASGRAERLKSQALRQGEVSGGWETSVLYRHSVRGRVRHGVCVGERWARLRGRL